MLFRSLPHSFISPAHSLLTHLLLSLQTKNMRETEPWVIGYYAIIASVIVFIFLIILMLFCCCTDCCNANRGQQPNSSIEPSPTVLPVHASSINNNYDTPLPVATNVTSGTTYTNSMGIQLQVAPPVVVDMSTEAPLPVYTPAEGPLPVYTPSPSVQDIQFSSHPRPTFVTTVAEDSEPVESVTRT